MERIEETIEQGGINGTHDLRVEDRHRRAGSGIERRAGGRSSDHVTESENHRPSDPAS